MSLYEQTRKEIEDILRDAFSPSMLSVLDDSKAHQGHLEALAHPGSGHFIVVMQSAQFDGKNPVERHRLVYGKLTSLMDSRIHALRLQLKASNE